MAFFQTVEVTFIYSHVTERLAIASCHILTKFTWQVHICVKSLKSSSHSSTDHLRQFPQRLEKVLVGLRDCVGGFSCEAVCGPEEIALASTSGDMCCPGSPSFPACNIPLVFKDI